MANIQDRGKQKEKRWQARYRDPDGRQVSKSFRRKIDADRWLKQVESDMTTGRYMDPKAGRVTLESFAKDWLKSQTYDDSTREAVESRFRVHILPHLGHIELRNIRPSTVQSWLRSRQTECAPSYVRVMLANLSGVLGAAVDDGLIASNPCQSRSVKPPAVEDKLVVPWTAEMVQDVIAAHPERYQAVPVIAAGLGLRQGEVFGLRVVDVDFLRQRVLVRQQVKIVNSKPIIAPPKRNKTRTVPLPDAVAIAINGRLQRYPARDGLVFTSREGGLLNRQYFNRRIWKPALVASDIEPTRENGMHALRHYFASLLLEGGVSIRALADYLGHSDPGFTLRVYSHLMPTSDEKARAVVDGSLTAAAVESSLNDDPGTMRFVN